jgi:glycosyltransferase involved in cell wall biosynthesis
MIAVFLPSLGGGGAERTMVRLANGLAEQGERVDLVVAGAAGPLRLQVASAVQIVDLRTDGAVLKALVPLAAYLRRQRPSTLISAMSHANVIAICASMLTGRRTKIIVSERTSFRGVSKMYRSLPNRLVRAGMALLYRFADGVTTVADAIRTELIEDLGLPPERVHTVYNPVVDDTLFERARAEIDDEWFRAGEPPVVIGIGRLAPEKNFELLIRAFATVRRTRVARLLILGEGAERDGLTRLVAELELVGSVRLPGYVSNPMPYLAQSSVFVLSSNLEGMPGVLVEALALSVPVVSTDCLTGPAEILQGGKWGALVPMDDVNAMADAIGAALDRGRQTDQVQAVSRFMTSETVSRYRDLARPAVEKIKAAS